MTPLSKEKKKLYRKRLLDIAERLEGGIGSCTAISNKPLFGQSGTDREYPFLSLRKAYRDFFEFSDCTYADFDGCDPVLARQLCILLYREVIND